MSKGISIDGPKSIAEGVFVYSDTVVGIVEMVIVDGSEPSYNDWPALKWPGTL